MRIACIGKRDLEPREIIDLQLIGKALAERGNVIVSGNARGSDQCYALGANQIDQTLVELHLPWASYERQSVFPHNTVFVDGDDEVYQRIASQHHPAWANLSRGPRALHTRNVGIVMKADHVIALPNPKKPGGGGTGMGMRLAAHFGIRITDISNPAELQKLLNHLGIRRK